MILIDRLARTAVWKLTASVSKPMYAYLARHADDDLLFMNWAYEEEPPMALRLDPSDEPHRYSIQLYHATATQAGQLTGKRILEVGCGQGGGASYLTRALKPARYIGLDLNGAGIAFCRRRHRLPELEFIQGHAEDLPFPAASFDAVINVESSHFYPHFDRFVGEVARVLRPGGTFLYTDVRQWFGCDQWEADLGGAGMRVVSGREINTEVRRGIELNTPQWKAVWARLAPRFLQSVGQAPTEASPLYRDLKCGKQSYRMYCLTKDEPGPAVGGTQPLSEAPDVQGSAREHQQRAGDVGRCFARREPDQGGAAGAQQAGQARLSGDRCFAGAGVPAD